MTCPDCATARETPTHGIYRSGCMGCEARMLAHSPAGWRARHGITFVEIQDALDATWRDPQEREKAKREVWRWIKLIGRGAK